MSKYSIFTNKNLTKILRFNQRIQKILPSEKKIGDFGKEKQYLSIEIHHFPMENYILLDVNEKADISIRQKADTQQQTMIKVQYHRPTRLFLGSLGSHSHIPGALAQ